MTIARNSDAATSAADLDALLVRAATGDGDAFVAFYDATSPLVFGVLRTLTRDPERLLEDSYMEAWERLRGRAAPPCPGLAWMSLIAHRHAAGQL